MPRSAPKPNPYTIAPTIEQTIALIQRRLGFQRGAVRLLLVLAAAAWVPLFAVVMDHTIPGGMPRWLIAGLGAGWGIASLAIVSTIVIRTIVRPVSSTFAARAAEDAGGIPHNLLLNSLFVRRSDQFAYAGDAASFQASHALASRPDALSPHVDGGQRVLLAVLASIAGWLLLIILTNKSVATSVMRFFGANVAAPTANWIEMLRPSARDVVRIGDSLEFVFEVNGPAIDRFVFERLDRLGDGANVIGRHVLPRIGAADGSDRRRLMLTPAEVNADVAFRCAGGDAVYSGTVRVLPRAQITSTRLTVRSASHSVDKWTREVRDHAVVIAGSNAKFEVTASGLLQSARVVVQARTESRVTMMIDSTDRKQAAIEFVPRESASYQIEITDVGGGSARAEKAFRIDVVADAPPTIEFLYPGPPPKVGDWVIDPATVRGPLRALAGDDHGLSKIDLVIDRGGEIDRVAVNGLSAGTRRETAVNNAESSSAEKLHERRVEMTAEHELRLILLSPGEFARVWFEAQDNRCDFDGKASPQLTKSSVLTLRRPTPGEPPRGESGAQTPNEKSGGEEADPPQDGERNSIDEPSSDSGDSGNANEGTGAANSEGETAEAGDPANGEGQDSESGDDPVGEFVDQHGEDAREAAGAPSGESSEEGGEEPTPEQNGEKEAAGEGAGDDAGAPSDGAGEVGESQPSEGGGATKEQSDSESSSDADTPSTPGESNGNGAPNAGGGSNTPPPTEMPDAKDDESAPLEGEAPRPPKKDNKQTTSDGRAETLDLLARMKRGESIDEKDLVVRGWTPERAAAFIRDLKRLAERLDSQNDRTPATAEIDARVGSGEVSTGADAATDGRLSRDVEAPRDDARDRRHVADPPPVPPHLKKLLDGYFRSMSKRQATTQPVR